MSQFGMQMPGGRGKRGASMDIYTALGFAAVAFLVVACAMMWQAAAKVGKGGAPFELQKIGTVDLKKTPGA